MINNRYTKTHRFLSAIRREITGFPYRITSLFFSLFPIKANKIIIDYPFHRESSAVSKRLLSESKDYDIVFGTNKKKDDASKIRYVKPKSLKYLYELATAGIWIDSIRKEIWVHKRAKQLYIQTWHAPVSMKKIELDAANTLPEFYLRMAIKDSKMADYLVAESKQHEHIMSTSFWYNGPIIKGEFKDGLFDYVDKKEICKELSIEDDIEHLVLYAPTFRIDKNTDCYNMDYDRLMLGLQKKYGGKWGIIIRLHPIVSNKCEDIQYSERIINGTNYSNLADLISISDILITDYSSCMFYAYRLMKKVYIYASDFYEYMNTDRGSYLEYDELPGIVSKNTDELLTKIEEFDDKKYLSEVKEFNNSLGYFGKDAMDEIVNIIDKHISDIK